MHRLGVRLRLVSGDNTIPLGLTLGGLLWAVLAALALAQGVTEQLLSISIIGIHVRLLLVIPLFFVAESWLNPRMAVYVRGISRSGVVPPEELPALEAAVARTIRRKDSWVPDVVCLGIAVLMSVTDSRLHLLGATAAFDPARAADGVTWAGEWYWVVCLPCFRFLMFRWLWRLGLWWTFLWRLSRLRLHLVPTHPDRVGGLGTLDSVHVHFMPLAFALSAQVAASLAEELSAGMATFDAAYPTLAVALIADAVLFVVPVFFFAPKLWACRLDGLREYMALAGRYVSSFDDKWVHGSTLPAQPLLGTPDLQSLADLNNSVSVIRGMRLVPAGRYMLISLALAAALPLLPLLLFEYPLHELAQKLFTNLVGL